MKEMKFFVCEHCGNVVEMLHDSGVKVVCCGEPMVEMKANITDGAQEKHVPVVEVRDGNVRVQVGSVLHPMLPEHYIGWIWLQTGKGGQRRWLSPGEEPVAEFVLAKGDKPLAAYEWCNIHGLWKAEL